MRQRPIGFEYLAVWICALGAMLPAAVQAQSKTLDAKSDPPYFGVYTRDGHQLLTTYFDKTLKLWDVPSGTLVRSMTGHTGIVLSAAISPDGLRAASGSLDNSIRLWDLPQAAPRMSLQPHAARATVSVSQDGTQLLTGGGQQAKLWNIADPREPVREFGPTLQPVQFVAFRGDKGQAVLLDQAGVVRVYNAADGTLQALFGAHPGEPTALQFAPNQAWFVTAGADGMVRRWPNQFTPPRFAKGHTAAVIAARVSPNNAHFVTASRDKTVRLWNWGDVQPVRNFEGHTAGITCLSLSSDGGRLVTGSDDGTVRIYDVNQNQPLKVLDPRPGPITAVAVHPGNQELAAADGSGKIKVVRLDNGMDVRELAGHAGGTTQLAYTVNGNQLLSSGNDKTVRVWAGQGAETNQARQFDLPEVPRALSSSMDAQFVAVGTDDKLVRLFSLNDGSLKETFAGHTGKITALDFSRDQQKLLSASEDGTARVWDWQQSKKLMQYYVSVKPGPLFAAGFYGDSAQVLIAGDDPEPAIHPLTLQKQHVADDQRVNGLAIRPDSAWYATAGADGKIKVWEPGGATLVRAFEGIQGPARAVAFNPNNQQIAGGGSDKQLLLWNINDGKPQYQIKTPAEVVQIAYTADQKKLLTAGSDNLLRGYNPELPNPAPPAAISQDPVQVSDGHTAAITSLITLPDNKTALSTAADGSLKSWAIASAAATATISGHSNQVYSVAFHPDLKSNILASSSYDKTIRLWNLENNQQLRATPAQGGSVYVVQFLGDGQQLITAAGDGAVKAFKTDDLQEVRKYLGPTDAVYSLSISPDGQRLVGAGLERKIYHWNIDNPTATRVVSGHKDDIYRVEFNRAGTRILSLGYAGNVRVWDANSERMLWSTKVSGVTYSASYSPDGKQIAVMAQDGKIHLLDVPPEAQ